MAAGIRHSFVTVDFFFSFSYRRSRSRSPRRGKRYEVSKAQLMLRPINWNHQKLEPVTRLSYRPKVDYRRSEREINEWRKAKEITTKGRDVPDPALTFEEVGFPAEIADEWRYAEFTTPTPIQSQGWPIAMSGRDMVGIAKTGSGKTLSYLLPALMHIEQQSRLRRGDGPIALILAPTRELAQQIKQVTDDFGRAMKIKNTCLFGGGAKRQQGDDLRYGVEIVIATPGRLIDFLSTEHTNLRRCSYLVLDEVSFLRDNIRLKTASVPIPSSQGKATMVSPDIQPDCFCWILHLKIIPKTFV